MLLRAFAKINLDLRILGRRSDGYHEIDTTLQTIDWCDEIQMDHSSGFKLAAAGIAEDETNLVTRAVRAFERLAGFTAEVHIRVVKNIPVGRGLGGGSADAAVTFVGLQKLFGRELPFSQAVGALRQLGSDVPFFLTGGTARGSGRGDEINGVEDESGYWIVVVDAGIAVPTAQAYSWLTETNSSNTIKGFRAQVAAGRATGSRGNDFELPVFARYPVLSEVKVELLKLGAFHAALSGSGSAVFGQFREQEEARRSVSALAKRFRVKLTKPLSRREYFQRMLEE
jgi:4-diphosphocytidyl-2-C-methyl-D-erythritol kinase